MKRLCLLLFAGAVAVGAVSCGPEVHNVRITEDRKVYSKPKPKPVDNPRDFVPQESF